MKALKSLKPKVAPVPYIPRAPTDHEYVEVFFNYVFHQIETHRTFLGNSLRGMTEANASGQSIRSHLESSITVFDRATQRAAQEEIVAFAWKHEGDVTMNDLRKFVVSRILSTGSGGTRSCSPVTNLVAMMTAETWCRVLGDLGVEK